MKQVKTVFISGKITGDPLYRMKFERAQRKLEAAGFTVMSPAVLPSNGFPHRSYMKISCAMLDACDAVYFLPDWEKSKGAVYEFGRAVATGKEIINGIVVTGSGCAECFIQHAKARA